VDFDVAWDRRIDGIVDPASGLRANLISRDDLIAAKLVSGKPQDIADVSAIEKAADSGKK
jgi:hypothetical protein